MNEIALKWLTYLTGKGELNTMPGISEYDIGNWAWAEICAMARSDEQITGIEYDMVGWATCFAIAYDLDMKDHDMDYEEVNEYGHSN